MGFSEHRTGGDVAPPTVTLPAITDTDWRTLRHAEFPAALHAVCLNTRERPLICRRAADAAQRHYADLCAGRVFDTGPLEAVRHVQDLLAGLLSVDPHRIVLAANRHQLLAQGADAVGAAWSDARVRDISGEIARAPIDAARSDEPVMFESEHALAGPGVSVLCLPARAAAVRHVGEPSPHISAAAVVALRAGLELIRDVQPLQVAARLSMLTDRLRQRLAEGDIHSAGFPQAHGQTRIAVRDAPAAARQLAAAGIFVSLEGDDLVASPHMHTLESDVDRLAAYVADLQSGRPLPVATPLVDQVPLVCVDLNGVLDTYTGWRGPGHWDPPATGAGDFLHALRDRGYRVVVFTTRHYAGVWSWLAEHRLAALVDDVTDSKPAAHVFVDDRAIRFTGDHVAALAQIDGFLAHWEPSQPSDDRE